MRVKVSIATDMDETFQFPQTFRIKAKKPSQKFIEVDYRLPVPVLCNWVKVKIQWLGDSDNNLLATKKIFLRRIGAVLQPTAPVKMKTSKGDADASSN